VAAPIISIDGSQGEGGGQILRTAVGLAAALGHPVRIHDIRANRPVPGLRPQHLAAVRAAALVCGGELVGDEIGSRELTFRPGAVTPGQYRFDIGTAGSTSLVCQTVLPALLLAAGDSSVTVTGGTHNPMAPCFEYLQRVFGVLISVANAETYFEMVRPGFYPAGGGELRMDVRGLDGRENVSPLRFTGRGDLKYVEGVSAVSVGLADHVAERQTQQVLGQLAKEGLTGSVEQATWRTDSPGTMVFMRAVFARSVAGFFSLGKRGKPAERVADEAVLPLIDFLNSSGAVDCRAADQLLPPAAVCLEESRFRTDRITRHLLANAAIVEQLTARPVRIEGQAEQPGEVIVEGLQ